jgi:hypothetical protein
VANNPFETGIDDFSSSVDSLVLNNISVGSQIKTLFCGPAAICAVTGIPAREIIEVINDMRGNGTSVEDDEHGGMADREVACVLAKYGYHAEQSLLNTPDSRTSEEPPVEEWMKLRMNASELNIVTVRRKGADVAHYITTKGGQFVDNGNHTPTSVTNATNQKYGIVKHVMVVSKTKIGVSA